MLHWRGPVTFSVSTVEGVAHCLISQRLLPYLLPHIQSLVDSERREIRVPARWETGHEGTDQPHADWDHRERYEAYAMDAVVRDSLAHKLSVLSISPIRFEGAPYAPRSAGVGDVVVEYIGMKMIEWKGDHCG